VNDTEIIRPLKDVWLRPRRVFRELGKSPIGPTDYLLAAVQGIGNYFFLLQMQPTGTAVATTVQEVLLGSLLLGPFGGIVGTWLFTLIYSRLLSKDGTAASRPQVFHILAYGGVPMALSALLWGALYVLLGDAALPEGPGHHPDTFVLIIVRAQLLLTGFLFLWSTLLQVMGFSEISNERLRRSVMLWAMGQVVGALVYLLFVVVLTLIAQGLGLATPPAS
jgi:hypothetical protein